MRFVIVGLIVLILLDVAFEAARFYYHVRVSAGLVAKAVPYQRAEGSRSMLVLGDSAAAGVGADIPADTVAGYLSDALDMSAENYSKSGAVTDQMLAQLSHAKSERYDLILIQVGANDIIRFHPVDQVVADLGTLLSAAREKSDHVVLLTGGTIGEAPLFPWFVKPFITHRARVVRDRFKSTADHNDVAYVDLINIPDPFNSDPNKYYAPDGLHLTKDGWHFWYEATLTTIEKAWPGFAHER